METWVEKQRELVALEGKEENYSELLAKFDVSILQKFGLVISNCRALGLHRTIRNRFSVEFSANATGGSVLTVGAIAGVYPSINSGILGSNPLIEGVVSRSTRSKLELLFQDHSSDKSSKFIEAVDKQDVFSLGVVSSDVTQNKNLTVLNHLEKYDSTPFAKNVVETAFFDKEPTFEAPDPFFIPPSNLNSSQAAAVEFALRAEDLALIHGPPGTGKTTTIVELFKQIVMLGYRVLAVAPSNVAVDNLLERCVATRMKCTRLGNPARVDQALQAHCLDVKVSKSDMSRLCAEVQKEIDAILNGKAGPRKYALKGDLKQLRKELKKRESDAIREVLSQSDVVLATCVGADDNSLRKFCLGNLRDQQYPPKPFDYVVVDEAAQALEVSTWIPALLGRRLILCGDHQQLPPTIKSTEAEAGGLGETLFSRMMSKYKENASALLSIQYRMNTEIMNWSSQQFYDGKIEAAPEVASIRIKPLREEVKEKFLPESPVVWIDTCGLLACYESTEVLDEISIQLGSVSKANRGEATVVRHVLSDLVDNRGIAEEDICVITPYRLQVDVISSELDSRFESIRVATVDSFQGQEKEVVVISLVRSNDKKEIGFLKDYRRLNVAVTRAKRLVVVIGNSEMVDEDANLNSLHEYIEEHKGVVHCQQFEALSNLMKEDHTQVVSPSTTKTSRKKEVFKQSLEMQKNKKKAEGKKSDKKKAKDYESLPSKHRKGEDDYLSDAKKLVEEAFLKNQRFELSSSLSSYARMILHQFCNEKGIPHVSEGVGEERRLVILPSKQPQPKEEEEEQEAMSVPIFFPFCKLSQDKDEVSSNEDIPISVNPLAAKKSKKGKGTKKEETKVKKTDDDEADWIELQRKFPPPAPKAADLCAWPDCAVKPFSLLEFYTCKHCNRRFCSGHSFPEEHGCGASARIEARERHLAYHYGPAKSEATSKLKEKIASKKADRSKLPKAKKSK